MSEKSVWGIDIGGSTAVVGILDGNRFRRMTIVPTGSSASPESILGLISQVMRQMDPAPAAIGIGIAGLVDHRSGVLITSPNLPAWSNCHVSGMMESLTSAPVKVDNDCNVFAYGGLATAEIPSDGLHIVITLGTGIGGTIVLDGDIVYGMGHAGEFGHMTVSAEGIPCPCGSIGCWERYAARDALMRYFARSDCPCSSDPKEIAEAARRGDRKACAAFSEFGRWVGIGLASLANCFNPDRFFLAGGLACTFDLFENSACHEFLERCDHDWCVSILGSAEDAGARGAAFMAESLLG